MNMNVNILVVILAFILVLPKDASSLIKKVHKRRNADSSAEHIRPRIIGGSEAVPHSRPYQAFLHVYESLTISSYCGGVLISANYVLSTASCGQNAIGAFITLGAHNISLTEPTQLILNSTDIKTHPGFKSDPEEGILNDIAVFKLSASVTFNEYIQPAVLPRRSDSSNSYAGVKGVISGWGATDGNSITLSDVLNIVETTIITNEECHLDFNGPIADTTVCTTGCYDQGGCNGDAGGPLTVQENGADVVVGIDSFGRLFCPSGAPSGLMRVTSYLDWIEENSDVVIS